MASYYDRSSAPYATRRPDGSGPSRSEMYYEREPVSYPARTDGGYVAHERLPVTRDERAYYQQTQSQGYTVLPRESRGLPYESDGPWAYGRRGSPSPAPSPHLRKPYDYRGTNSAWEEPDRWNSSAAREYETSDTWRRRDPPSSRLSTLLNPSRTETDVRKYQEPPTAGSALPSAPGYDRSYLDYSPYETRPTAYRERSGRYNPESYGPPTVYGAGAGPSSVDSRWPQSPYAQQEIPIPIPIPVSGPTHIASRPSAIGEYKKSQSHYSEANGGSGWGRDARSRQGSFSSAYPSQDYRSPQYTSKVPPSRHIRELSNEDIALREAARSAQTRLMGSDSRAGYRYGYHNDVPAYPTQISPPLTDQSEVWDPELYSYVPARTSISSDARSGSGPYDSRYTQSTHSSPVRREAMGRPYDDYSPQLRATSPAKTVASSRPGIMSVHNLVSPAPAVRIASKPASSPILDEDSIDMDLDREQPPTSRRRLSINKESPRRGEVINGRIATPATPPSIRRHDLELPAQVEDELDEGLGIAPMEQSPEPEVDFEKSYAEFEGQVNQAGLPTPPKSNFPLLQDASGLTEDGLRALPPRPKADQRDITETLRKAIMLRRTWETQSREQRIGPILLHNLMKVEDTETMTLVTAPEQLIKEVKERVFTQPKEEQHLITRSALASNFSIQQESIMEKKQRLKREYLELHEAWLVHCNRLDSLYKTNDIHESIAQGGRVTRRSSQALGDVIRSDLEMEQIIASLGNEDLTDPNHLAVRNVATIPDMISVEKGRVEYAFNDTNGRVDDPTTFYDPRSGFHDWTPEEEKIFYNKYAEYPKQFGIIASFIEHKSATQCVLYYYIHKKRLIDFRNAASMTTTKRKKGTRKQGKQKGNALLADVQQADRSRPPGRGRRRGRGGAIVGERGRGAETPPSTAGLGEPSDGRLRRRRAAAVAAAKQFDFDDSQSVDTDVTRDTSVAPPKKRRGRKPRSTVEAANANGTATPGEGKVGEGSDSAYTPRRKPVGTATTWTDSDREEFLRLLAKHGKDFKRISAALPSKTAQQCTNFYKNHNKELGLEKLASTAQPRTPSPETSLAEQMLQDDDARIEDATSGVGDLSLNQNVLRNGNTQSPPPSHPDDEMPRALPYLPYRPSLPYGREDVGRAYIPAALPSLHTTRPPSAPSAPSPLHSYSAAAQIPGRPHSVMNLPRYSMLQAGESALTPYPYAQGQRPLHSPEPAPARVS